MNRLPINARKRVLSLLLECCSVRATSRLTGVHKTTITRLLVEAGEHCWNLLDRELRGVPCEVIEADEIWTFMRKKQIRLKGLERSDRELGAQ